MSTVIDLTKFRNTRLDSPHTPFDRANFSIKKEKYQLWSTNVTSVWESSGNMVSGIVSDLPLDVKGDALDQLIMIEAHYFKLIKILRNYEDCVENGIEYEQENIAYDPDSI